MIRLGIAAGLVLVAAAVIAYAAYWHTPSAESDYVSPFLSKNPSTFVEVAGYRVHVLDRGSGPAVLLIHGGGTWLYSFRHNLDPLARTHRVIAVDMPGHGYTKAIAGAPDYDFEATDRVLLGLVDAMGVERVSLVGHSWGGGWALHFAQRHPARVRKLVLIGSSGLPVRERLEWELLKYPVIAEVLTNLFRVSDVETGLRAAFADPDLVTEEMVREIYAPLSAPESRRAQVDYSRRLDWTETEAALPSTRVPTLVIWGALDGYADVSTGRALADALPEARFEVISDAGHSVHEEKPDVVNPLLIDFLAQDDPATKRSGWTGPD